MGKKSCLDKENNKHHDPEVSKNVVHFKELGVCGWNMLMGSQGTERDDAPEIDIK